MLYPLSYEGRRLPSLVHEMGVTASATEFQAIRPPFGGLDLYVSTIGVSYTCNRFRAR
jgi:hypothetical protein